MNMQNLQNSYPVWRGQNQIKVDDLRDLGVYFQVLYLCRLYFKNANKPCLYIFLQNRI